MKQVIQQLKAAQLKARKELIALTGALQALGATHTELGSDRQPRKLSKAAREKIAAAQRRRWAKVRREK
jgi:hypothetical protein